ncbi:MAG: 5'/3'-nucleotidase SurE [Eubacterium sp.]|nr:5'/3'-nucleotidase SurE [Eubacterium sp.]
MKRILITNDDGIDSDGLIRLARAALKYGEVWVVAPESQRSACSHAITLRDPIEVTPYPDFPVEGVKAFSCTGTPADCVRVGGLNVVPERPHVLLSGINYGYNAATDIQYSGTLGAAFEGAFQGYHAIAVSESADPCHETADAYLDEVLAEAMEVKLSYGEVFNINFPHGPLSECKGILRDRTVSRGMFYRDQYKQTREREDGVKELMVDGQWTGIGEEGTDLEAIVNGYVSLGFVKNCGC